MTAGGSRDAIIHADHRHIEPCTASNPLARRRASTHSTGPARPTHEHMQTPPLWAPDCGLRVPICIMCTAHCTGTWLASASSCTQEQGETLDTRGVQQCTRIRVCVCVCEVGSAEGTHRRACAQKGICAQEKKTPMQAAMYGPLLAGIYATYSRQWQCQHWRGHRRSTRT